MLPCPGSLKALKQICNADHGCPDVADRVEASHG